MGGILHKIKSVLRNKVCSKPVTYLQVELTNHCNYSCRFCPQSQYKKAEFADVPFNRNKGFMSFDVFKKAIENADKYCEEMNFSFFGEPTMHPDFLDFITYARQASPLLRIVMNTNLSYATRDIFQKLIEVELTELRLSLDAATAETYDQVRPGTYFVDLDGNRSKENRFETICKKAEYWFSLPNHCRTRHVFTVNSKNVSEIKPFVEKWQPHLGKNDFILTKNVLTYGGKVHDTYVKPGPCRIWENNNFMTVDWQGNVSPCNLDTNMDLALGNLDEHSLLDLHNGEDMMRMANLSRTRELVPCKTCIDSNSYHILKVFKKSDQWDENIEEYYKSP